jgi:hypothetical protein
MRLLKVLLASLFVSSAAVAGEINGLHYGSVSLGYTHATNKVTDSGEVIKFDAFKGPVINAETVVADRVLLGVTYGQFKSSNLSVDGVAENPAVKSKITSTFALIGYRLEASQGVDILPYVEHRRFKVSVGNDPSTSDNDTAAGVQLRAALGPKVELHVTVARDDVKTNSFASRAIYKADKTLAAFVGHTRESGTDSYRSGLTILGVSYLF